MHCHVLVDKRPNCPQRASVRYGRLGTAELGPSRVIAWNVQSRLDMLRYEYSRGTLAWNASDTARTDSSPLELSNRVSVPASRQRTRECQGGTSHVVQADIFGKIAAPRVSWRESRISHDESVNSSACREVRVRKGVCPSPRLELLVNA